MPIVLGFFEKENEKEIRNKYFYRTFLQFRDPEIAPFRSGWDKIFHFVGANTFSQKFRPKQRESDATKDSKTAIIWVFLPVTRNVFL